MLIDVIWNEILILLLQILVSFWCFLRMTLNISLVRGRI